MAENTMDKTDQTPINLDPENMDEFRTLAHRMVDDVMNFLDGIAEKPVWEPILEQDKANFSSPLPRQAQGEAEAYQDFKDQIFSKPMGNFHPRFWGWVMGNGVPYAAFADLFSSIMNPNMGGGDHIPNYVERQVVNWCKEMMGFPADSSGLLVSGGSMANFIGLAVARNAMAGFDVRNEGVAASPDRMTVYASTETHSSNYKAIEQLGIGKKWMRFIPVDSRYSMDIEALEEAIAADKAAGYRPICIIGNAATTNTGAFDDLTALADIAQREGIWFHVDGAFGALARLSEKYGGITAGMERADSLAFDLHKWMYLPMGVACILIRDFEAHINTFTVNPDYLSHMPRGLAGGSDPWYGDLGLELTRSFRALKVWMTFKAYGIEHFARQIEQDIDHANYLAGLVEASPRLELLDHVPLNVVCFRYVPESEKFEDVDGLNREIMLRLHERGLAVPSYTRLNDKFALRVSVTNHRSKPEDFDFLVEKIIAIAEEILSE
jgi:glutamate/tyrosine decarboxylase-like PLP-dependent enzyme